MRFARALGSIAAVLAATTLAAAAPDDGATAKKEEALRHFSIGVELAGHEAWDAALVEFMRSREIYPTRVALKNAAACLRELHRYDEALDMYDELVERFAPDLSAEERSLVDGEREKLATFVGSIEIEGAPAGARLVIDGRDRGTTPLTRAVRVSVGTHRLSLQRGGYAPYETTVAVSSGEVGRVAAKLDALTSTGRLRVTERRGRRATLLIDGAVVGSPPWEGVIGPGMHTLALRGPGGAATAPQAVEVKTSATSTVELELLPPRAASRPARRKPQPERWRRFYLELVGGLHNGGDLSTYQQDAPASPTSDKGGGIASLSVLRAGYALQRHLAIELAAGVILEQNRDDRTARTTGAVPLSGGLDGADVGLGGLVVAASPAFTWFEQTPLTLRWWLGVAMVDASVKGGDFHAAPSGFAGTFSGRDEHLSAFLTGPELRFGYRFGRAFMMDVGVVVLRVFTPAMDPYTPTTPGTYLTGNAPVRLVDGDGLSGGFTTIVPTLGLHVDL